MIHHRLRLPAVVAVCGLALLLSGCGSNNKGKIEGKWKMISSSQKNADFDQLQAVGVTMAFDFKADGTFAVEFVPLDDKPESKMAAQIAGTGLAGKEVSGKYTLAGGDKVNFSGAKDIFKGKAATSNVTINGDSMTMKDPDGTTLQLTRVKAAP